MVLKALISFAVGVYAGVHIADRWEIPSCRERREMYKEMRALWTERMPTKDERREIFDDIRAVWMERMEERMAKRLEAQLENETRSPASIAGEASLKTQSQSGNSLSTAAEKSEPKTYRQILEKYRRKRIQEMDYEMK